MLPELFANCEGARLGLSAWHSANVAPGGGPSRYDLIEAALLFRGRLQILRLG